MYDGYNTEDDEPSSFNSPIYNRIGTGGSSNAEAVRSSDSQDSRNYFAKYAQSSMGQSAKHKAQITNSGNLILHHVTKADRGSYVCRAMNMVGSRDSEAAILSVHGKYIFTQFGKCCGKSCDTFCEAANSFFDLIILQGWVHV